MESMIKKIEENPSFQHTTKIKHPYTLTEPTKKAPSSPCRGDGAAIFCERAAKKAGGGASGFFVSGSGRRTPPKRKYALPMPAVNPYESL